MRQIQRQDLVTLAIASAALLVSLVAAWRGSARGTLTWMGLLGYTYTGTAFAYSFNFLLYVALFSLSISGSSPRPPVSTSPSFEALSTPPCPGERLSFF